MNRSLDVLVVGGGGREHAIAWAVAKSPRCGRLFVAPGNAGTPGQRVPLAADDVDALVAFATTERVDVVIVGPEAALAAGLADRLAAVDIDVFGATRLASEIEWSKSYARTFCDRHAIVGPRHATFTDLTEAQEWIDALGAPVVIKADGLAAGKGVVLPDGPTETTAALVAWLAHGPVVVEERLVGEEVSLLAFTDGRTIALLPPAQDHKRIGEGDRGANTGGMGAYAPAPVCPPELAAQLGQSILQRAVDGLRAEGRRYVGVLYAGLMLTADGPRVLEFNARFGDPETQVQLPLLQTDLLDVVEACVRGRLADVDLLWRDGYALTVVAAAPGYPAAPELGALISGLDSLDADAIVFHAGTAFAGDGLDGTATVTSGGRVLAATGLGATIGEARAQAYAALASIDFAGVQVRRDIGWRAIARTSGGYAASGVDITAGNHAVELMKKAVAATYTPAVVAGVGSFGGVIDLGMLRQFDQPVLVASTDGVGTKVMAAMAAGRIATVGTDLVNHCIGDVLVQNARPLAFLDYVAASRLDPEQVASIVTNMAEACREAGIVLLGGETAEMPGVYAEGHLDVAGTMIALADRAQLLPLTTVAAGDVVLGLASSGPHTNGYSLLRRVFAGMPMDASPEPLDGTLADALLAPHRNYLAPLGPVLDALPGVIKALAHITGGGLVENPVRILPPGHGIEIQLGSWPVPPLFRLVRDITGLPADELHRSLNMGIGMVAVVAPADVEAVQDALGEESWVIGRVVEGERHVVLLP